MATIVQQDGGTDKVYPEKNRVNTSSYTNENQSSRAGREADVPAPWLGSGLAGRLMDCSRAGRPSGGLRPVLDWFAPVCRDWRDRRHGVTGITQYLTGVPCTFSTLTANPKFPTKIAQAVATAFGCFPYLTVSDAVTQTNVHGYVHSSNSGAE